MRSSRSFPLPSLRIPFFAFRPVFSSCTSLSSPHKINLNISYANNSITLSSFTVFERNRVEIVPSIYCESFLPSTRSPYPQSPLTLPIDMRIFLIYFSFTECRDVIGAEESCLDKSLVSDHVSFLKSTSTSPTLSSIFSCKTSMANILWKIDMI